MKQPMAAPETGRAEATSLLQEISCDVTQHAPADLIFTEGTPPGRDHLKQQDVTLFTTLGVDRLISIIVILSSRPACQPNLVISSPFRFLYHTRKSANSYELSLEGDV
jgi:hypothetical protein